MCSRTVKKEPHPLGLKEAVSYRIKRMAGLLMNRAVQVKFIGFVYILNTLKTPRVGLT